MKVDVDVKTVQRNIYEYDKRENAYIFKNTEDVTVPTVRKVSDDADLIIDIDGDSVTVTRN